jgi:hypothetical protein
MRDGQSVTPPGERKNDNYWKWQHTSKSDKVERGAFFRVGNAWRVQWKRARGILDGR